MDDTVTIRTSDDPPVRLEASRAVLAANSKVFADMLSVPQSTTTAKHGAIDVAEHKIEIMPFLRLLNLAHEQGEALQELEDKDWPVVAKLADKYDSAVAKAMALAKCWSVLSAKLTARARADPVYRPAQEVEQRRRPRRRRAQPRRRFQDGCYARARTPHQGVPLRPPREGDYQGRGQLGFARSSATVRASLSLPLFCSQRLPAVTQLTSRSRRSNGPTKPRSLHSRCRSAP